MTRPTYHLVRAERWRALADGEPYAAATLTSEGFAHCTDGDEAMLATANRHYRGDGDRFIVLTLDLARTGSPWRFDDDRGSYPHVYGPIARSAVTEVHVPVRGPDGTFLALATPAAAPVADAIVRRGETVRQAPLSLRRLAAGDPVAGPAIPVRHAGSVDVFLEALERAPAGAILAIDNEGRTDEGCIGDLVVAETAAAGLAGILLWGAHRDTAQLRRIGLPLWSLGSVPAGPRATRDARPERLSSAVIGDVIVTVGDIVVADDDGVVIVDVATAGDVLRDALGITAVERGQAELLEAGTSLREQFRFGDYLARRSADPGRTFRRHLAEIGGAIET